MDKKLNFDNLLFRKLSINDNDIFIELRMVYLNEEFQINDIGKIKIQENLSKYFSEHILKDDFIGMVCEYNGIIISVAFMTISEKPPNPNFLNGKTGTLLNVYTFPEYRRNGIATKLLKEIISEAKKLDIKTIDLEATDAGVNLYEKLGFTESKYKSMSINI